MLTYVYPFTQVKYLMKSPNLQKVCDFSKPNIANQLLNISIV